MDNLWYDVEDFSPNLVCWVELSNGQQTQASFVCGNWETLDGEVIHPIKFKILKARVLRGLYEFILNEL